MSESRMKKTELLSKNMWSYFKGGFGVRSAPNNPLQKLAPGGGNYIDGIIILCHLALFPVSVPVVGGLKTLVDIKTRKEISLEDLRKIEQLIETLPDNEFDQFIENILKYRPWSNSSIQLQVDLATAKEIEKNALGLLSDTAKSELKKATVENFWEENSKIDNKKFSVTVRSDYQFTEKELASEKKIFDDQAQKIAQERRQKQRALINNYLEAEKNVGKKMQHVIKEEVERSGPKP